MKRNPRLFIGSAKESLRFVNALKNDLHDEITTELWNESFRPSHYTLEELTRNASEVDFAIFILGDEDKTESRGGITLSPRDNVVYEAGLFAGSLGVPRVFLLIAQGTKIPTDWKGLTYIPYDPSISDSKEAMREACETIRNAISDWKKKLASSFEQLILDYWWQFVINSEEGSVLSLMSIMKLNDHSPLKVSGEAWTSEGKHIAKYWSRATALDTRDNKLFYYWEGEYPHDKSIPKFVGVGEIDFSSMQSKNINMADGWYSETPLNELNETVRKSTKFLRANEQDVQIMNGGDRSLIQELLNSRILKLKEMNEAIK